MRSTAIVIGCLLAASLAVNAQTRKETNMYTKGRVGAHEFMIFPWGSMPGEGEEGSYLPDGLAGTKPTWDSTMKDLWECGFNATGFTSASAIPAAKKYGLGVFLHNNPMNPNMNESQAFEAVSKLVKSYHDDPTVVGLYIRDEPNTADFGHLGIMSRAVQKASSNLLPYLNLLPDYASNGQLGADSYAEYIDKFVKECSPKFLSYDNYSLFEGKGLAEDRFFTNLESMRAKGLQYNLPFWNIVLGNCHFEYQEPSQATINVQVWSSLAYGAKGISYFTYYAPLIGNYRLAAIDQFGFRTKTWEYVRFMNLQIHQLAPTYMKLKSVNVFHTGNVPKSCSGLDSSHFLSAIEGNNLLVGEFVGPNNTPYLIVVNKSTTNSTWFNPTFKDKGTVMCVNAYRGIEWGFNGENLYLAPGQGMMLYLKK